MGLGALNKIVKSRKRITDGLFSYYRLDGNANDYVGNHNPDYENITYYVDPDFGTVAEFVEEGTKTLEYPYNQKKCFVENNIDKPFSISIMVFNMGDISRYVSYTILGDYNGYMFYKFNSYISLLLKDENDGFLWIYNGDGILLLNKWYHITVVYNGDKTGKIYINGIAVETLIKNSVYSRLIDDIDQKQVFGKTRYNDDYYKGYMRSVGFWDKALTDIEVAEIYQKEFVEKKYLV